MWNWLHNADCPNIDILLLRCADNFLLDNFPPDNIPREYFPPDTFPRENSPPRHFPTWTISHCAKKNPDIFPLRHFPTIQRVNILVIRYAEKQGRNKVAFKTKSKCNYLSLGGGIGLHSFLTKKEQEILCMGI